MKSYLLALTVFVYASALASETTLHETPLYSADNGPQIGTLKTGVDTEAGKTTANGFAPVLLQIDAPASPSTTLKKGSKLQLKGFVFGEVSQDVNLDYGLSPDVQAFRAFVKVKDLNPASIPERALEKTLAGIKAPTQKNLGVYIRHFHFRDDTFAKKFTNLQISTNLGDGLAVSTRLNLIFVKDELVGIIHLYDLKLKSEPKEADEKLHDGRFLKWISKSKTDRAEFIKEYNRHVDTTG